MVVVIKRDLDPLPFDDELTISRSFAASPLPKELARRVPCDWSLSSRKSSKKSKVISEISRDSQAKRGKQRQGTQRE